MCNCIMTGLVFIGFSEFHLLISPCISCLPLHPLPPTPTPSPPAPTLKMKFALGALQKDGTHRVQIVIAVTAQRPGACLCDLEGTLKVADVRETSSYGTNPATLAPSRAKPAEKAVCAGPRTRPGCLQADDKLAC